MKTFIVRLLALLVKRERLVRMYAYITTNEHLGEVLAVDVWINGKVHTEFFFSGIDASMYLIGVQRTLDQYGVAWEYYDAHYCVQYDAIHNMAHAQNNTPEVFLSEMTGLNVQTYYSLN